MGRNIGFVIGINQYDNLRHLKYARQDAESVRDFCQQLGCEEVYFFAEDAATIPTSNGVDLKSSPTFGTLSRFLRVRFEEAFLQAGDNLWFFFAGHGKRANGRDYLLPSDADPGNVENTALAIQDIVVRLRRSGAGNVILLLDACRDDGSRGDVGIGLDKQQGVITFYSCAPEQESFEIDELGAGAFTYALLKGLQIQGEGNCATVERLFQYLQYQVPYLAEKYKRNRQNPYLVAEPVSKQHLILLPKQASIADIDRLKQDALRAEVQQDLRLARELWIRVLAILPAEAEAVSAIERLARKPQPESRSESFIDTAIPGSRSTLDRRLINPAANFDRMDNMTIDEEIATTSNEMDRASLTLQMTTAAKQWVKRLAVVGATAAVWSSISFLAIRLNPRNASLPPDSIASRNPSNVSSSPSPIASSIPQSTNSSAALVKTATQSFSQGDLQTGQAAVEELLNQGAVNAAEGALNTVPPEQLETPSISFLRGRLAWESTRRKSASFNLEDARRYWLIATKAQPTNPSYQNVLGFAHHAEGKMDLAKEFWEKAASLAEEQSNQEEKLTAEAGQAIILFRQSEKSQKLKENAIELRDRVIKADPNAFKEAKLAQDWRWSEAAIADWKKLMELK